MKAKCSPQQMIKVIQRNMAIKSDSLQPEHKLILAIIGCAISDLLNKAYRSNAEAFFNHTLFSEYCNLIGLNPVSTRELLVKGNFLH